MALIYVVEDDKNIQEIETFALANVGYEVKGFDSATDFYAALNETAPDLILLDIMLPDEDGLSIVKKLRTRQDTVLVPVIMVTAKTTEIDKVKGLDLGADDYITKPFGVMELISRVKAMLRRSQKTQEKDKVLKLGNIVLDREKHSVMVGREPVELTYKDTSDDDKEKTVTFYVGSKDDSATYYYVQMDGSQRVSRVLIDTVEKALGWKVDSSAE